MPQDRSEIMAQIRADVKAKLQQAYDQLDAMNQALSGEAGGVPAKSKAALSDSAPRFYIKQPYIKLPYVKNAYIKIF